MTRTFIEIIDDLKARIDELEQKTIDYIVSKRESQIVTCENCKNKVVCDRRVWYVNFSDHKAEPAYKTIEYCSNAERREP